MSSKLSFSRRQVLKFRSIDSGSDPTSPDSFNLPSPEPIGESNDLAMGVLGLTLVALKELSSLAEQIPYICPVASIILDALKMKDEVKQYKEEWEAVMEKLHNVGTVVVYVGKMCQRHGLKKEELPSDLLTVLGTLQSDLDGIDTALKKCAEIKGVKEVPLRADMLRKVKQYDRSLFNILQVFQARQFLSLLAQIIRQRNRSLSLSSQMIEHTFPRTFDVESETSARPVVDQSGQALEESRALIRELPYIGGWPFGDEKRCLPGTREDFLNYIVKWVENPKSERALVILGRAGTGKSSIAHEIARRFENKCLGSYFAFLRKEQPKGKAYQLFTTLACDLSDHNPAFKLALGRVIKNRSTLRNTRDYRTLFERLLLEPLKNLQFSDPVLIVIDALDESEDAIGRKGLHTVLARHVSEFPSNFRILITSRPEKGIESAFANASSVHTLFMDDSQLAAKTVKDISTYLENELPPDVFKHHRVKLTKAAEGWFQWAAVASEFINGPASLGLSKKECIQRLLEHSRGRNGQGLLDTLYEEILNDYFKSDESQLVFRSIMGQLLAAIEPVSIGCLIALRRHAFKDDPDDSDRVLGILSYLGSLLSNVPSSESVQTRCIAPLHSSFRDFLASKKSGGFYVDLGNAHHQLAHSCLDLMLDNLKFNICELESSYLPNNDVPDLVSRIAKQIPPALSYACAFWGNHLERLAFDPNLFTKLRSIFETKFLFWLEVLSLTGRVSLASPALSSLKTWLQSDHVHQKPSRTDVENLLALVNDASAFVRYFGMAIARSAPHIYVSALPFAPTSSLVLKYYHHLFRHTLTLERGQLSHWPTLEMVIQAQCRAFSSIAFSPDGRSIASASWDDTIHVRDAATGELVAGRFTGHTDWIESVAFSPDGQHIASASHDRTIRVWDVETGEPVAGPFTGHTESVSSVAFSPDGQHIASGSVDRTIRVWDAGTGEPVAGPFTGHADCVLCVAFSPDGQRIASSSSDCTVRVWDAATGELVVDPFTGHTKMVNSLTFSPNGRHIASGSHDGTIRVWDASTGEMVAGPFTEHTSFVYSVAFSSDGQWIASASGDRTICLWDAAKGELAARPFTGHTSSVFFVAFSPDEKRIASASQDGTIRMWNATIGEVVASKYTGHNSSVSCVTFSPDGRRIASASWDRTICVWDAATGELIGGPFTGHTEIVTSVTFSPDGRCIASASQDCTVRVWDIARRALVTSPFTGHTQSVDSVAFSPDGQRIASTSFGCAIRVWDAATGKVVAGPFTGHSSMAKCVAFSPNGKRIASASADGTICLWDAVTGEPVADPFTGHDQRVSSIAFSPDGKRIASASWDCTIRVWDAVTGVVVAGPFTGHTGCVSSVAFSPDGKRVASASYDCTVRVWDATTGKVVAGPFTGHTSFVLSVSFSPDGQHTVSGSGDGSIRMEKVTGDVKKINVTDKFLINSDGWMCGEGGELLLWIPDHHRPHLHRPNTAWIAGKHETRLNLSKFAHGPNWTTAYIHSLQK